MKPYCGLTNTQRTHVPTTDAVNIGRLVKPDHNDFSSETARDILSTQLIAEDQRHMHELSPNPKTGTLTPIDQGEVEGYRRVGYWRGFISGPFLLRKPRRRL